MASTISTEHLDKVLEQAFIGELRKGVEAKLMENIKPLIDKAVDEAISHFSIQVKQYLDCYKDERQIHVFLNKVKQ